MLHAIDALTGKEIWGFVPPFVAALLPQIVNKDYDGAVGSDNTGGTNPIFGVDGSPVVHDLFIQGYTMNGGVPQLDAEKVGELFYLFHMDGAVQAFLSLTLQIQKVQYICSRYIMIE